VPGRRFARKCAAHGRAAQRFGLDLDPSTQLVARLAQGADTDASARSVRHHLAGRDAAGEQSFQQVIASISSRRGVPEGLWIARRSSLAEQAPVIRYPAWRRAN
jgi:hypothetical protein